MPQLSLARCSVQGSQRADNKGNQLPMVQWNELPSIKRVLRNEIGSERGAVRLDVGAENDLTQQVLSANPNLSSLKGRIQLARC